jgi:outer membrane protein
VKLREQLVLALIIVGWLTGSAWTQGPVPPPSPLTLQQAVRISLEKNPLRKAALADAKVASAEVRVARAGLLPNLNFAETATRGNDPVYVFGSRLRQQRFTSADFALNQLNTPLPFGNFSTRLGGSWNLFDSMASWRRVEQAKSAQEAAEHQLDRSDQEIVFHVVNAYHGVLLARKRLEVAEQAVKTAQSILDRSQARFESGLSVESDRLNAQVRMSTRQQELIRAQNDSAFSLAQLDVAMGMTPGNTYEPSETLSERQLPLASVADLEKRAAENRPDLKRIQAEESAQKLSVAIAKSSFGPRVSAFASWQADNPTFLAGGGGNNWVGGIELQLDLFTGGAKRAELSRQTALQEKVAALKQAATDGVRLEVRQAFYDADAANRQVGVARAAVTQAQESLRISRNRYDAGLLTMTDLLSTEEATLHTQLDYWQAVSRFQTSYANLELASGTLGPDSPVVQP